VNEAFTANHELASPPIDIVKLQRHYLAGTLSEPGEQNKDCVVSPTC
jgi:hypothetical protein